LSAVAFAGSRRDTAKNLSGR